MKEGDKLYCIKNFKHLDDIKIHKGKIYEIYYHRERTHITKKFIFGRDVIILDDLHNYQRFSDHTGNYANLWEYFITLQEHRKMKLEEINKNT
jgi:hypothetical protein